MNITKETNLIHTSVSLIEFKSIIKDLCCNSTVLDLRNHAQHADTSRFTHCLSVSFYTYAICKKLGLDYISAARGAMLHDLYFYDWKDNTHGNLHAFRHPRIALNNASEIFELNKIEKDVILKHMWPLTVVLPKYKESYIITIVDKYCATIELFNYLKKRIKERKKNHD